MTLIKVTHNANPAAVAGAIAHTLREGETAQLQAIGADAVNQTVKAIVAARRFLTGEGCFTVCYPDMLDIQIDGAIRTVVRFTVVATDEARPAQNNHF